MDNIFYMKDLYELEGLFEDYLQTNYAICVTLEEYNLYDIVNLKNNDIVMIEDPISEKMKDYKYKLYGFLIFDEQTNSLKDCFVGDGNKQAKMKLALFYEEFLPMDIALKLCEY